MTTWQDLYDGLEDMSIKGGSDIGVAAARSFFLYVQDLIKGNKDYLRNVQSFGQKIKELKPSMGTVHNVVNDLFLILQENKHNPDVVLKAMDDYVNKYQKEIENSLVSMANIAAHKIEDGDCILTHSYTRSVLLAFERALKLGKIFSVFCTESRPLKEGAHLATLLSERGLDTTLITDAAVARYMPKMSKVIVGADAIYVDGTVVNKMGTLGVAIISQKYNKPVYVLSITAKLFLPSLEGEKLEMERRQQREIIDIDILEKNSKLSVENVFFEEVPPEVITYLVTEKGIIKPSQIYSLQL